MSRGPGRIERIILDVIERQRRYKKTIAIAVVDIVELAYPQRPWTRAQKVATYRAMHRIAVKVPGLILQGGKGKRLVIMADHGRGRPDHYDLRLARRGRSPHIR